jgi:hypothetical protein
MCLTCFEPGLEQVDTREARQAAIKKEAAREISPAAIGFQELQPLCSLAEK